MNDSMNIGIVIPELVDGGAERVVSNLSQHLPDKHNKFIVLFNTKPINFPVKGTIIDLSEPPAHGLLKKLRVLVRRIIKMKKIKKMYSFDSTISFLDGANIVNLLAGNGERIITSVRNYKSKDSGGLYGQLFKFLIRLLYNKSDAIIAVSRLAGKDLCKNFGIRKDKIRVIYNPCDIEKIDLLAKEEIDPVFRPVFRHPVIINIGKFAEQKGQKHLLKAFSIVKKEIPGVLLVILGRGELENSLKELAVNLGIANDVYFPGYQQNPFKFISRSEIFVQSSLFEGFPNALFEAMACGIPVISTDCRSGPREILAPDTDFEKEAEFIEYAKYGVLVPVCKGISGVEERNLAEGIIRLLSNKNLMKKYSEMGRRRVEEISIREVVKNYESVICG